MTNLRTLITSATALLCLAVASPASAQEAGSFKAKFTKVVDNCESGLDLSKASLSISKTDRNISVLIDSLPPLTGKAGKRGKLRAEAKGKGNGMDARYGLNGRVSDGALQAVFVAEYFKGETPVCTQSFRVVGKAAKTAKKSSRSSELSSGLRAHSHRSWHHEYHRRALSSF